jgi:hypothetical protein
MHAATSRVKNCPGFVHFAKLFPAVGLLHPKMPFASTLKVFDELGVDEMMRQDNFWRYLVVVECVDENVDHVVLPDLLLLPELNRRPAHNLNSTTSLFVVRSFYKMTVLSTGFVINLPFCQPTKEQKKSERRHYF